MDFKSLMPFGRSSALSRTGNDSDPFVSLRREMDRLFDDFTQVWDVPAFSGSSGMLSPRVDVAETEKGIEIKAELPGIDPKDIDLDLTDGVLTLKAERKHEKEEKDERKQYHLVERSYGTFLRRFALPFEPDQDKLEASFDKGVLKIFVPRSAAAAKQVKKIQIKGS